eukprot:scaffold29362_cov20-Tisochrysis_lutea.AAC.2
MHQLVSAASAAAQQHQPQQPTQQSWLAWVGRALLGWPPDQQIWQRGWRSRAQGRCAVQTSGCPLRAKQHG